MEIDTKVKRIPLNTSGDLEKQIKETCAQNSLVVISWQALSLLEPTLFSFFK